MTDLLLPVLETGPVKNTVTPGAALIIFDENVLKSFTETGFVTPVTIYPGLHILITRSRLSYGTDCPRYIVLNPRSLKA